MKDVKDLQTLINERAESRLERDIQEAVQLIRNNPILKHQGDMPRISMTGKETSNGQFPYWFFQSSGDYMKAAKEHLLPLYIQEETKMFMGKVENLQGQIDELLGQRMEEQDLPY